ncbi:MAG: beta-glycosidase [Muribaculaceae bacterium]|nr:beta-glycosidase [Muribaculaceae bacterium]
MRPRILLFISILATYIYAGARSTIDLSGEWFWRINPFEKEEVVTLPGTMDTNGKGTPNTNMTETTMLSRKVTYAGPAWYSRDIDVPSEWKGSDISLMLERTRPSTIYVDGKRIASCRLLSTPHRYNLSDILTPGKHHITIMVDNGDSIPEQIKTSSHACTEATQTNWNGILGRIELTSVPKIHIRSLELYPDVDKRSFKAVATLSRPFDKRLGEIAFQCGQNIAKATLRKADSVATTIIELGDDAILWSENSPVRHRVDAILPGVDTLSRYGALRKFEIKGHHFAINDTVTFLRGRHDACVFPLTGFAPMDTASWLAYFRKIKEYGLNHVRFHSWCPPEACFEAADIEGIYLQPELPIWGTFNEKEVELMHFLHDDGEAIQREYSAHPSFAMFGLGNELWGEVPLMQKFTNDFRAIDGRHLYTFGSNAFLGWQGNLPGQDFWVTCRNGGGENYTAHTRASFSFADAVEGGIINNTYPNTTVNFEKAVASSPVPIIGHETGQYQIFPRFEEIAKYTGVLDPRNLQEFKRRLEENNLGAQASDFFRASGKWAVELYKADMEMNFRTPSMAGFQLLDIQDYPGQGTALVGILDAFMDSKGLVTPGEWRRSCDKTVVMAELPRRTFAGGDTLSFALSTANYSSLPLDGKSLRWSLNEADSTEIAAGTMPLTDCIGYQSAGVASVTLPADGKSRKLTLNVNLSDTDTDNSYAIWVYPVVEKSKSKNKKRKKIVVTTELEKAFEALSKGKKVLFAPPKSLVDSVTVGGLFQTDYWNYRMFRTICDNAGKTASPGTMGIVCDPSHPALADFPNDGHTDWQWYPIVKASYPLILDRMNYMDFRPVVQVIDNIERNHRLGLVMEFNVGRGRLLLLMTDMNALELEPESRQFVDSLINYLTESETFTTQITLPELRALLTKPEKKEEIDKLSNISYD